MAIALRAWRAVLRNACRSAAHEKARDASPPAGEITLECVVSPQEPTAAGRLAHSTPTLQSGCFSRRVMAMLTDV